MKILVYIFKKWSLIQIRHQRNIENKKAPDVAGAGLIRKTKTKYLLSKLLFTSFAQFFN